MNVIVPAKITDASLISSSIPEPDTGEVAWNSGTTYAAGAEVYLASTHRRYRSVTSGNVGKNPATDTSQPAVWVDIGPTNKWAAFDGMVGTKSTTSSGTLSYTLRPGYITSIAMFGISGTDLSIVVKDTPGGNTIYSYSGPLDSSEVRDWYDYWFGGFRPQTDFIEFGIEPYNAAEVTISITGIGTLTVGAIIVGELRMLGETQKTAKSKIIDYSRYKTDEFGNTTIVTRPSARDMTATVYLPVSSAPMVEDTLDDLRGVPAVWAATDSPNYKGLRTYGLGSGSLSYDDPDWGNVSLTLDIRGLI